MLCIRFAAEIWGSQNNPTRSRMETSFCTFLVLFLPKRSSNINFDSDRGVGFGWLS